MTRPDREFASAGCAASLATTVFVQIPLREHIPIAANDFLATAVTVGTAPFLVLNVACVGVSHTVFRGDFSCPPES